jgi:hypothetical protein
MELDTSISPGTEAAVTVFPPTFGTLPDSRTGRIEMPRQPQSGHAAVLRGLALTVCLVTCLAVALVLVRGSGSEPLLQPARSSVPERSLAQAKRSTRIEVAPAARLSVRDDALIRVVDRAGVPVPEAGLYSSPRWATTNATRPLAVADQEGTITIAKAAIPNDGTLVVNKSGYVPAMLALEVDEQTVVLDRGIEWSIPCADESGRAIADVLVAVSISDNPTAFLGDALEAALDGEVFGPGPDASRAVFVSRSGGDGVARFAGIPAGRYYLSVRHPSKALVEILGASQDGYVAGSNVSAVLCDVLGAAIKVEGDEVVFHSGTLHRDQFDRRVRTVSIGRRLRKQHPDGILLVHAAARPLRASGELPTTRLSVLLRNSGWVDSTIHLKPIESGIEVQVLRPTPGTEGVCLPRRLLSSPALAVPEGFPAPRFVLRGRYGGRELQVIAALDRVTWLPPGEYAVEPLFEFVAAAFDVPPAILVTRDGEHDVVIPRKDELVPCELSLHAPDGMPVPPVTQLALIHRSGPHQHWPVWDPRDEDFLDRISPKQWVLPGVVEVHVKAPLLGRTRRLVDIRPSKDILALRIQIGRDD